MTDTAETTFVSTHCITFTTEDTSPLTLSVVENAVWRTVAAIARNGHFDWQRANFTCDPQSDGFIIMNLVGATRAYVIALRDMILDSGADIAGVTVTYGTTHNIETVHPDED